MDWKKFLPINLLAVILIPSVLAQDERLLPYLLSMIREVFTWILEFFFGGESVLESNILLIKFGLWLMTLAILFWVLIKANIIEHRAAAGIIAAVVSLIGVKFMPDSWVMALATVFRFIVLWIVIIIVVPYLVVTRLIKTPGWPRRIILAIIYVAIFFGITQLSYFEFGSDILTVIMSYFSSYSIASRIITAVAIVVIALWLLNRSRRITEIEYKVISEGKRAKEGMRLQKELAKSRK